LRAPDLHVLAGKRVGGLLVFVQHLVQLRKFALDPRRIDPERSLRSLAVKALKPRLEGLPLSLTILEQGGSGIDCR
jgi:hypothetical protein